MNIMLNLLVPAEHVEPASLNLHPTLLMSQSAILVTICKCVSALAIMTTSLALTLIARQCMDGGWEGGRKRGWVLVHKNMATRQKHTPHSCNNYCQ